MATLIPGAYVLRSSQIAAIGQLRHGACQYVAVPLGGLARRAWFAMASAELVPVTIGRDYGNSVEVVSGLQPTDPVIVNPSDSLITGTPFESIHQPSSGRPRNEVVSPRSCSLLWLLLCAGCMVGPDYFKPSVPMTPAYKEDQGLEARAAPATRSPAASGGRSSAIRSSTRWKSR